MCCKDFYATVFASIFSIVQSIIHLGFCVWGANFYLCYYSLQPGTFKYMFYMTYFYTNSCIQANISNLVPKKDFSSQSDNNTEGEIESLNIEFPPQSALAERTYNIMNGFIIIDTLWIIASIALLLGVCCQVKRLLSMVFYFPWVIILLAILFFDAVAMILFGLDISSTASFVNWFLHIGGKEQADLAKASRYIGPYTFFSAVLMTTIFTRFIFIWFINFFLLFRITQAAINAIDEFNDDTSNISSKANSVDIVVPFSSTNKRCSRNFQIYPINPILLDIRRRRSQIHYGTDEEEDENVPAVHKYKKKMKLHKQVEKETSSTKKLEIEKDAKPEDNVRKKAKNLGDNYYLTVVGGYEGDRSNSPSPIPARNKKQIFDFASNHTSIYVIKIPNDVPM